MRVKTPKSFRSNTELSAEQQILFVAYHEAGHIIADIVQGYAHCVESVSISAYRGVYLSIPNTINADTLEGLQSLIDLSTMRYCGMFAQFLVDRDKRKIIKNASDDLRSIDTNTKRMIDVFKDTAKISSAGKIKRISRDSAKNIVKTYESAIQKLAQELIAKKSMGKRQIFDCLGLDASELEMSPH